MSTTTLGRRRRRRSVALVVETVVCLLILIWTLMPLYTMVEVALGPQDDVFSGNLWPSQLTFNNFRTVLAQGYWYVANFWQEMGNSLYIGVATALLTLGVGTLTAFVIGRMRLRNAWIVSNAALLTYVIPMSFL